MDYIKRFLRNDKFAEHVGIHLLEVSVGGARAKLEINEKHLNGADVLHGGAIFALADFVFAAASNSHGTIALAINANISYLKAVNSGILIAEAKEVSLNPKLATYRICVTNEDDELIATFQGMVYRKKDRIEDRLLSAEC